MTVLSVSLICSGVAFQKFVEYQDQDKCLILSTYAHAFVHFVRIMLHQLSLMLVVANAIGNFFHM